MIGKFKGKPCLVKEKPLVEYEGLFGQLVLV